MLLGIIWLRVQNAFWAANFIQVVQGAIVVRILMSEQEQAQRPHDSGYLSEEFDGEDGATSYLPELASRGSFYPPGHADAGPTVETGAAPLPSQAGATLDLDSRDKRWAQRKPIVTTSHHCLAGGPSGSPKSYGEEGYSLRSLRSLPSDPPGERQLANPPPDAVDLDLILAQQTERAGTCAGAGAGSGSTATATATTSASTTASASASVPASAPGAGPYDSSFSHAYPPAARQH